jgi:hypothetical protein
VIEWNGPNSGIVGESTHKVKVPEGLAETVSPEELLAAVTDPVRTLVAADGWKLTLSTRGEHELYNLAADPGETTNLTCDPRHAGRIREMAGKIRGWQQRTGDTVELPGV